MAMDAKEIEQRGKDIGKAVQENASSAAVIKLLNELKSGVHATEDVLRSTKIGVTINRLRSHKDPALAKLATELVSKWREEVKKQPKKGAPARVAAATNGSASPAPTSSAAASPAPSQSKNKHTVDPAKRNHKTDKVNYEVTGEDARDMSIRLMYDGLAHMSTERKSRS
jgi:transcription elongation factor S-II